MRLGNIDLNENEAEWTEKFSKNLLAQAYVDVRTALNKRCSEDDVKSLLSYLWSRSETHEVESDAEVAEADDDDE